MQWFPKNRLWLNILSQRFFVLFVFVTIDREQDVAGANREVQRPYQRISGQTSCLQKPRAWGYRFGFRREKKIELLDHYMLHIYRYESCAFVHNIYLSILKYCSVFVFCIYARVKYSCVFIIFFLY